MGFTVYVDDLANGLGHLLFEFFLRVEFQRFLRTAEFRVFQRKPSDHLKHLRANPAARSRVVILLEHCRGQAVCAPKERDNSFEHFGTVRNVVAALGRLGQEVLKRQPFHLGEFVSRPYLLLAGSADQLQSCAAWLAGEVGVRPWLLHAALSAVPVSDFLRVVCEDFTHVICPTGVH